MKRPNPYEDIDPDQLIVRDWLALSRSRLANERTLLAYIRTGIAMMGLGVIVAKWVSHDLAMIAGSTLVVVGAAAPLFGFLRFVTEERRYRPIERGKDPADTDTDPR